ncbi:MAG: alpha-E domain-containing protein [Acidimicrobiales bacterium]
MILARHAEAMFWAGRLLERAEHTTRMLDVVGRDSMHFRASPVQPEWRLILETVALHQAFLDSKRQPTQHEVVDFLFFDRSNSGSVAASVSKLRENIRTVRDRVPVELWEETNRLHLSLEAVNDAANGETFEPYSTVRRHCHAIGGVIAEAMPRDEGFTFLVVGRMIERATMTCRTIRCLVLRNGHNLDEGSILRTVSSLQAFRRSHRQVGDPIALAAFLLRADHVPRSVLSCLRRADGRLGLLGQTAPGLGPATLVCGRARARLEYGDIENELRTDPSRLLLEIEGEVNSLAMAIAEFAFDPAQLPAMRAQFVRPGFHG